MWKIQLTYMDAVRFRRVIIGLGSCKCVLVLLGESSLLKPMSLDMIKYNVIYREIILRSKIIKISHKEKQRKIHKRNVRKQMSNRCRIDYRPIVTKSPLIEFILQINYETM